jgi:tetratricopeptide (TPR) repeat protein
VLSIEPENEKVLYKKGLSLSMLGLHVEAIHCLEKALEYDSSNADAWVIMSNSCFMLGKLEESARAFDEAYYIDIRDVRANVVKGLSLLKSGKFDDAIRCFSDVLGILLR